MNKGLRACLCIVYLLLLFLPSALWQQRERVYLVQLQHFDNTGGALRGLTTNASITEKLCAHCKNLRWVESLRHVVSHVGPIGRVLPPKQESRLRQGPKTDRLQCACQTLHWFRLYCRAKLPVAAYGGEARQSPFTTNPKACVFRQIS